MKTLATWKKIFFVALIIIKAWKLFTDPHMNIFISNFKHCNNNFCSIFISQTFPAVTKKYFQCLIFIQRQMCLPPPQKCGLMKGFNQHFIKWINMQRSHEIYVWFPHVTVVYPFWCQIMATPSLLVIYFLAPFKHQHCCYLLIFVFTLKIIK